MAIRHAARVFVDKLAHAYACRRELYARVLDAAGDREAAEAFAVTAAM
jgi:hypothetical protein